LIGGAVVLVVGGVYYYSRSESTKRQVVKTTKATPAPTSPVQTGPKPLTDESGGEHVKVLYQDAEWRFNHVSNVEYELMVALPKGPSFSGKQKVSFDLRSGLAELSAKRLSGCTGLHLDLQADSVSRVLVNGKDVTQDTVYQHRRLELPASALLCGERNVVEVSYERKYGNEGTGLHSMTDSKDGNQYLFSQFESPYCHQFMPCFDQPSLKAVLNLTVLAPNDWKVISNEPVESKTIVTGARVPEELEGLNLTPFQLDQGGHSSVLHVFKPTHRLSTYLYAICAGKYFERTCTKPGIVTPLRLFCRQTYKHLLTEEYAEQWFDVTDYGLRFHGEFMGVPYPYGKLDQVFCPEYNWGAMENVGCITYTEHYLPKVTPTRKKVVGVHNTILHELAHQWFGNLITMHWWEDLWLNESFATFMATLAQMSYSDEGDDANIDFLNETIWGMVTDQRETTHPIAAPTESVTDTEIAERNFDGISYGKGGSWLKQLHKFVTPAVFKEGIQRYFKKHSGGNTKLTDFVASLNDAVLADAASRGVAPIDLKKWARTWLEHQGVMTLKAAVETEGGHITSFKVEQGFGRCADPVFKQHRMDIIIYDKDMNATTKEVTVEAEQSTDLTTSFKGLPMAAVLLNANCFSYVKVSLQQDWIEFLTTHFDQISDPLDKFYLCFILVDMVRDGLQNPVNFIKFFVDRVLQETQAVLLQNAMGDVIQIAKSFVAPQHRDVCLNRLQAQLIATLKRNPSKDIKNILVNNILGLCVTQHNIMQGLGWLEAGNLEGEHTLEVDQAREVLVRVCSSSKIPESKKQELEERYIGNDKSSDAKAFRTKCEVARPGLANKAKHWHFLLNVPEGVSQDDFQHVCAAFTYGVTNAEMRHFAEGFFDYLPRLFKDKSQFYGTSFIRFCYPGFVDSCQDYLDRLNLVIAANKAKGEDKNVFLDTYSITTQDRAERYLRAHTLTDLSVWQE